MTNEPGKIIAEVHQSQELQASSFILDIISEQENPYYFLAKPLRNGFWNS